MQKVLSLAEVKKFYKSETCFEVDTAFIVNDFGKYSPNLSFIISKDFELDERGNVKDQFRYFDDQEVINNMNIDFNGNAKFMFGDFWVSKNGTKCFKPKNPIKASHVLIMVNWGGCFNSTRGVYPDDASKLNPKYYRRASSNGGGTGTDYWVFPVGYVHTMHIENDELSHGVETNKELYKTSYFSDILKAENEESDKVYSEAIRNKDIIIPKLVMWQQKLKELRDSTPVEFEVYIYTEFKFREVDFGFGGIARNIGVPDSHRYTEESVDKVEKYYNEVVEDINKVRIKYEYMMSQKEIFLPKYYKLEKRFNKVGYSMKYYKDKVGIISSSGCHTTFEYNEDDYLVCKTKLIKKEDECAEVLLKQKNDERILTTLRSTELPEEFYYLFDDTEELNEDIIKMANSIVKAKDLNKDEMDIHELTSCGIGRRCDAIYRLLDKAGGSIHLPLLQSSQSASMKLAHYIANVTE